MKKISVFFAIIFTAFGSAAQAPYGEWIGDTLGIWTVISFEDPTTDIQIVPSPQNIWEIGVPQKTFFNQAYSVPNAMVTGTTASYPAGNLSSFDLYVTDTNTNYGYPWSQFFIDFRHKFDTDTLHDGGFISVSWDQGVTFTNILRDTLSLYWNISPYSNGYMYGNTNLYDTTMVLANGEPGFSGHSGGWVQTSIAWYNLPVKDWLEPPDTMILRFSFYSDNNSESREGWMIDHIRFFGIDLGSGFEDFKDGRNRAFVAPNPVKKAAVVTLDRTYDRVEYRLADLTGKILQKGSCANCKSFVIDKGTIRPGIGLLTIIPQGQPPETHKVVFAD